MFAQRTGNIMNHWTVRHLRMHCTSPNARPTIGRDGVVAIAGVNERAGLARLLLADMGLWQRNDGASVTNAIDVLATEAHKRLIAGFSIGLGDTQVVELDGSGAFDLVLDLGDGSGRRHQPLFAPGRSVASRSRQAFLAWGGDVAQAMLRRVDELREKGWAGVEG
jgi:hypothetical protein